MLKLFLVGFLCAATIVIPGISGSFMLIAIGYYRPLLSIISEMIKFDNLIDNMIIMIPFGLGIVIGGFIIVKLIEYFLRKHEVKTYYIIIGVMVASIIEVVVNALSYSADALQLIVGIVLFVIGGFISLKYFQN
jgi:putative membrane protein